LVDSLLDPSGISESLMRTFNAVATRYPFLDADQFFDKMLGAQHEPNQPVTRIGVSGGERTAGASGIRPTLLRWRGFGCHWHSPATKALRPWRRSSSESPRSSPNTRQRGRRHET
jgi:hypothetical protein